MSAVKEDVTVGERLDNVTDLDLEGRWAAVAQHLVQIGMLGRDEDAEEVTEQLAGFTDVYEGPGRSEWLVLTDYEAEDRVTEEIIDSLWAFKAEWLAKRTGVDIDAFRSLHRLSEDAQPLIRALVDATCGIEQFVNESVDADGRGHFLSSYDGEEVEVEVDGRGFYLYRRN